MLHLKQIFPHTYPSHLEALRLWVKGTLNCHNISVTRFQKHGMAERMLRQLLAESITDGTH